MKGLTKEQKEQWDNEGLIILRNILKSEEIKLLLGVIDEVIKIYVKSKPELNNNSSLYGVGAFKILRSIEKTAGLDYLIDHEKIFGLITDLLGPYLQLMSTEIFVRNPMHNTSEKFHTDAGPSMQKILPNSSTPPIQLKVQFFLTDVDDDDCGNFMYIPGSHKQLVSVPTKGCYIPEANKFLDEGQYPPNTIQLKVKAGDILIFPWSMWHGVSRNNSSNIRRSICFRYGQLWCRPHDYITMPSEVLERMTPRQRRLCGDLGRYDDFEPSDYYRPKDQLEVILS